MDRPSRAVQGPRDQGRKQREVQPNLRTAPCRSVLLRIPLSKPGPILDEFIRIDEVLFSFLMIRLPPCHEGAADCRPDRCFQLVRAQVRRHI